VDVRSWPDGILEALGSVDRGGYAHESQDARSDHDRGDTVAPTRRFTRGRRSRWSSTATYECPYAAGVPIVQDVRRRLSDRLRFVFRNFPLTQTTSTPSTRPKW